MNHEKIDAIIDGVRSLAVQARAAVQQWKAANTDDGEGNEWATPPDDEREVLVFLNGHVAITDSEGRKGGGWGVRLGFYDHDRHAWYVHGRVERFVTHWADLPGAPING